MTENVCHHEFCVRHDGVACHAVAQNRCPQQPELGSLQDSRGVHIPRTRDSLLFHILVAFGFVALERQFYQIAS